MDTIYWNDLFVFILTKENENGQSSIQLNETSVPSKQENFALLRNLNLLAKHNGERLYVLFLEIHFN